MFQDPSSMFFKMFSSQHVEQQLLEGVLSEPAIYHACNYMGLRNYFEDGQPVSHLITAPIFHETQVVRSAQKELQETGSLSDVMTLAVAMLGVTHVREHCPVASSKL